MTLNQWSIIYLQPAHFTNNGSMYVYAHPGQTSHRDLYTLSDHKVSSVCGPITYLVPILTPTSGK